jgi:tRNA threonylcarbamoyladenosine biosynthesis protein TsaB
MIILGLDTALSACSAAVYDTSTGELPARRLEEMHIGHAERLPLMVRDVVQAAGVGFPAIDRIAVTVGPGTFTGVRIGLAFACGLGLALGKPVVGVSTLRAVAANVKDNIETLPIAVVIDARRGGVYLQIFAADLTPLSEPGAMTLALAAAALPSSPLIVSGSGASLLESAGRGRCRNLRLFSGLPFPDAAMVARLAAGMEAGPPPRPLYLRPSDARLPEPSLPPSGLTIEAADGLHSGVLAVLHAECFAESWDQAAFARLMAMPGTRTFLAYAGTREPSGFMLVRQAADEGEILTTGTRPAERRRGIATTMLAHASERLRSSGVRKLFIEVAASNAAARAFYARSGFEVRGARPAYYATACGGREDAVVMSRALKR